MASDTPERHWRRVRRIRDRIRALPGGGPVLKVAVATIGAVVVLLGLVLVPLPGPGWAIVFAGVAIWAIEFVWARHLLHWAREQVRTWTQRAATLPLPLRIGTGVVVLVAIATIGRLWL